MKALNTYKKCYDARRILKGALDIAKRNDDWDEVARLEASIEGLEEAYFNNLEKVTAEYWIGSRCYYGEVTRIGSKLLLHGETMTRTNGYHSVKIIPEITEEMRDRMISDMYYY